MPLVFRQVKFNNILALSKRKVTKHEIRHEWQQKQGGLSLYLGSVTNELSNIEHKMVTQYKFKQISKIKTGKQQKRLSGMTNHTEFLEIRKAPLEN